MYQKIMNELNRHFGDSLRDRKAKEIMLDNIKIEKRGAWYFVNLCGSTCKIHVNTTYLFAPISDLLSRNPIWMMANHEIKTGFRMKYAG